MLVVAVVVVWTHDEDQAAAEASRRQCATERAQSYAELLHRSTSFSSSSYIGLGSDEPIDAYL